jgi:hypothetical protein
MLPLLFRESIRFCGETRPPGDSTDLINPPHKRLTTESQFLRAYSSPHLSLLPEESDNNTFV